MIPLYLDEDSEAHAIADALREFGVDVLRTSDAGNRGLDDDSQLEFAAATNRAIVTANLEDFARLNTRWHAAGRLHRGIVIREQGLGVGEDLRRLVAMLAAVSASDLVGQMQFLSRWR